MFDLSNELWTILKGQPGVGVLLLDREGRVLFCNEQAKTIYYGTDFDPVGLTIAEIEGPDFAAERMAIIREVLATGNAHVIRHIRGGKHTEATLWPLYRRRAADPRVVSVTRQGLLDGSKVELPVFESQLVDLGPLDVLTRRELQVLVLIGHGMPLKSIARELGITQRSVERYRTDIARKLRVRTIAEIAMTVQRAGLSLHDVDRERLHRWQTQS